MKIREILTDMEQFIYTTEALNQILVAADCPENVRSLIDYLIGFSMGREEFKAFDGELSIYVQTENKSVNAANKWVSRTRMDLKDWQDKSGVGFVIHNEGDLDKNYNKKHRATYQLPILALIENVMNKAQEDIKLWDKNPSEAIKATAMLLVKKHIDDPLTSILKSPGYVKPTFVAAKQNYKSAATYMKKLLDNLAKPELKYLVDSEINPDDLIDLAEEIKHRIREKNKEAGRDT
jgi:hypothetical protein